MALVRPKNIPTANLSDGSNFLTSVTTYVQQVTADQAKFSVSNNGTWQNLNSVTITPQAIGNTITIEASFVYPKETSNFMNINQYRIGFGSTYVNMTSESFCYSDPYTHEYMTGLGHHSYTFVVDASTVGVAQTCTLQWNSGNGSFGIGSYLNNATNNIACKITAIERK